MSLERLAGDLFLNAESQGRDTLLESELYRLMAAAGIRVPACHVVPVTDGRLAGPVPALPGSRIVVKVESPSITHKTEMGGVRIVPNTPEDAARAASAILESVATLGGQDLLSSVSSILFLEFVPGEPALGGQVFAGLRFAPDMGPVMALGLGGLDTEEMSRTFSPGQSMVLYSPLLLSSQQALEKFSRSFAYRRLTGRTREARRLVADDALLPILDFFHLLASRFSSATESGFVVEDFEVNPFFVSQGALVAVDAFARFCRRTPQERTCDLDRVRRLLRPGTAAVIGASAKGMNVGRIILRNLLRDGFPPEDIRVIRDDCETLDRVRCCPSITSLPWTADMMVVAVGAAQVPQVITETVEHAKAASMVLIPGGMGETEAGREADARARTVLETGRAAGRAPVIVGPNCLGIRSRPGRYDTLFIPESKLPLPEGRYGKAALVCQSGALMITRMNALPFIDPAYAISTGNQMDLAIPDFVEYLLTQDDVRIVVLYVEGFKPLDGLRLARLVTAGRQQGKEFIVYRAGRTAEGVTATSSHTASLSGDFASCMAVLEDAGALPAASLTELKALLELATLLADKRFAGRRLGLISNAGFETVSMADNVDRGSGFTVPALAESTRTRIHDVLSRAGIAALINVHNPLDLTPMAVDRVLADCLAAYLDDPGVDAALLGFVPLTPAMKTLPPGSDPRGVDSIADPASLPNVLPALLTSTSKPVATVVDGGSLYDPLARSLQAKGIPCFRSADFGARMLQRYIRYRT